MCGGRGIGVPGFWPGVAGTFGTPPQRCLVDLGQASRCQAAWASWFEVSVLTQPRWFPAGIATLSQNSRRATSRKDANGYSLQKKRGPKRRVVCDDPPPSRTTRMSRGASGVEVLPEKQRSRNVTAPSANGAVGGTCPPRLAPRMGLTTCMMRCIPAEPLKQHTSPKQKLHGAITRNF
jgi:hypothetical protein